MAELDTEILQAWAKDMVERYGLQAGSDFGGLLKYISETERPNELWLMMTQNLKLILDGLPGHGTQDNGQSIERVLLGPEEEQNASRFELLVASKLEMAFPHQIQLEETEGVDLVIRETASDMDHPFRIETKMISKPRTLGQVTAVTSGNLAPEIGTDEAFIGTSTQRMLFGTPVGSLDLLLIDVSHVGISWIRPVDVWNSVLRSWYPSMALRNEIPMLAICFSSLDSTALRIAHTSLESAPSEERGMIKKVLVALDPLLKFQISDL